MKKILLLVSILLTFGIAEINIVLDDDIFFRNAQGVINAKTTYGNQAFQALGSYKVNKDAKVLMSIDRLMSGGKVYNLKAKPSILRQLKNTNSKLPKGSTLILRGENAEEFKEFSQIAKGLETKAQQQEEAKKKAKTATTNATQPSGTGSSVGNISVGSGQGATTSSIPYLPISSSSKVDDGTTSTTWSAQYCKVPDFRENEILLSVIDKDGNCVEKKAVRDDTKCEYRYDFANNVAIKQTQFYYVDNENTTQNVGDCVDLVGDEYRATLYKDDTRCKLETTDKDYGGGKGSFFVTQVLFRGIDGLIHEATDCIAYGNIKEELMDYDKDDNAKQAQRIVNQYYIDPYTNEKIYITKGVKTEAVFDYKEKSCGDWEMDDVLLQGKKRTQISFYDEVEYQEVPVTSCDFSTEAGKKSEYIMKYQDLSSTYKEQELARSSRSFSIPKYVIENRQFWCGTFENTRCSADGYNWLGEVRWTSTYITYDVTSYKVYLRPDGTEYKQLADPNGSNETFTEIRRETIIPVNTLNASQNSLLYYEINTGAYSNKTIEQSGDYQSWVFNKVGGNRTCTSGTRAEKVNKKARAGNCWSWIKYEIP